MENLEPTDIIEKAITSGETALNEYDAKRLLSGFGIPVCRETIAKNQDSAVAEAIQIGFPVVLKACGTNLFHKTEVGGIAVNLKTVEDVREASERLLKIDACEELLVQEIVSGGRELVCGMTRDEQFGPCIMFGFGGIFTELIDDAVFRMAPLTLADANAMIRELRTQKLIDAFRGEAAVDVDMLSKVLVAVGKIALRYEQVLQIDINPMKIKPDGQLVAVDALVVLSDQRDDAPDHFNEPITVETSYPSMEDNLIPLFEPDSVVIVGASAAPGKPGHEVIRNIRANDYQGELYLVNPKSGEILGMPVHASIGDLPEKTDLAIIILPAAICAQALRECAAKGIEHVVISAGGFAEVDDSGAKIQQDILAVLQKHNIRMLGPNTSGHISTPYHFTSTFFPLGKIKRGRVSYIAQTGNFATHTMKYILSAENFGVARVIGLGNAINIDESAALKYLAGDLETDAILIYLESFKQPKKFLEIAREVTPVKPVIMLKSGSTEAGQRAAIAHTAAMAAEDRLVDGMLRQAGIVRIWDYTHLILAGKALSMASLPQGNRVSFLAPSGAMLVVLTDLCTRLGLEVPTLEPQNLQRIQDISPSFIRMRNPVDIWAAASTKGVEFGYREGMEAVLKDSNIDAVVPILMLTKESGIPSYDFIVELARKYPHKPIFVTFSGEKQYMEECKEYLEKRGVPTFPEIEQPFEVLSILARCRSVMERAKHNKE
ncbi:MAG: acetate--CoA ligase family protein [Desulfobacterales bacterium]|nr:MAG: acetate--CoA ligase family protein [Desulfobacterales bacterium]